MATSRVIDLVSVKMSNHQKRVAYIAYSISLEMGLDEETKRKILLAGKTGHLLLPNLIL